MSDAALLEAVHVLNPRTLDRARRLSCALQLLRAGESQRAARVLLRQRFGCDRLESWRIVSLAADMAGAIEVRVEVKMVEPQT